MPIEINEFVQLLNKLPGGLEKYSCKGSKTGNLQLIDKLNGEYVGYVDMEKGTLELMEE